MIVCIIEITVDQQVILYYYIIKYNINSYKSDNDTS